MAFKKLKTLIALSNGDIWAIVMYGVAVGLLSLVVPIAAQGLVTIVSFGSVRQPLFTLCFAVFVLLTAASVFRIFQNMLVEVMQQRLFATIALKVSKRLPSIDLAMLDEYHGTELLNRFFDIVTLQKAIADILLSFLGIFLQSILGMLLLAIYHPALLAFDIIFLILITLIIYLPFAQGLQTALAESDAKYAVVGWLEELVRVPMLFHFQKHARFGFDKTDKVVLTYIKARQAHYRALLKHMIGANALQILASTSLFIIGGLLVLNNQMTLGQLVAAEIIVTTLGTNTAKLSRYLEKLYDSLAAAEKVSLLTSLPVESNSSELITPAPTVPAFQSAPEITVKNLCATKYMSSQEGISFQLAGGSNTIMLGDKQTGKSLLIDVLLGFREPIRGEIIYDRIPLKNFPIDKLREKTAFIRHIEIFDGTILENILLGQRNISVNEVIDALQALNLYNSITGLPQGLESIVSGLYKPLSSIELTKLMFVRAYLSKPYFMVIDEALDVFSAEDVRMIIHLIKNLPHACTLLATTRRLDVAEHFSQRIVL